MTPAQRRISLDEVERKARADLKTGGPDVAVDWAFKHARAVARLAEAEQAWKSFDVDRYRLQLDLNGRLTPQYDPATLNLVNTPPRDEYDALVMATASLHAAAADLGEARAIEVACAHVLRLLERRPSLGQASRPPAARTPLPAAKKAA